jgi:hypothetical protein
MHVNKKYGSYAVLLQLIRTEFCGMHPVVSHAITNGAWGCLYKNIIYKCKQRQIDTNVSPFLYCAEVFHYMFRPSRGHHQEYLTRIQS